MLDKLVDSIIYENGKDNQSIAFDLLDSIITEDYETDNRILRSGTWEDLWSDANRYDVYLFGTGRACKIFIERYRTRIKIEGVIDNNQLKHGKTFEGYTIYSPNVLHGKEETSVVIITTTSYMDDVADQLDEMGCNRYYGFAVLESRNPVLRLTAEILKFVLWKLLPVKKNRILIANGFRKYNDNARAITEKLLKDGYSGEILWLYPDVNSKYPPQVKLVKDGVVNQIIAHATSKIWIDSYKKHLWIKKKRNQYYINTWHGSVTLKKLDYDTKASSPKHLKRTEYDSSIIDLRVSNGKNCTNMYRNAMHYQGDVLECGSPRLDFLFHGKEEIRKKLNLPQDAQIVLYAPTWRMATRSGFQGVNCIDLDFGKLKKSFEEKFGGSFYFLIRLHPAAKRPSLPKSPYVLDVTSYDDAYELLLGSNVLISDYSSLLFEMGFIYKSVFLYAPDYDTYKKEHGMYFEYRDMPYPYAHNQLDLEDAILRFDEEKYMNALREFNTNCLGVVENGTATEQVCKVIEEKLRCRE